jgi:hypothetical protein
MAFYFETVLETVLTGFTGVGNSRRVCREVVVKGSQSATERVRPLLSIMFRRPQ